MKTKKSLYIAIAMLAAFLLWTAAISFVDVQSIGPEGSTVGFAGVNALFHNLTGVHMPLYTLTDWLSIVPLGVAAGFGLLGLVQWIQRRNLRKVDRSLLVLGGFYAVVIGMYGLFEVLIVNHRPVLIDGTLEASYPSSTTVLVLCVMLTAMMQFNTRITKTAGRRWLSAAITAFAVFMVTLRLISGVHWLTDIIGGALLSAGLVAMYHFVSRNVG